MQLSFPPLISGNYCLALKKCKSAQHAAMNGADVSVFSALGCYGKNRGPGGVRFLDGDEGMASTCTGTRAETRKGDREAPADLPTPNNGVFP